MSTCSNPGCVQPGTSKCSACKATPYCGPTCQTAHWTHHKEECPGHIWKVGLSHLAKANIFHDQRNCPQILKHADLAATKLKLLKDCPLSEMDDALKMKHNALNFMGRHREALETAKEWYCLYLTKHTHPPAIIAAFALIESCLHNREFADASLYALTTWQTITKDQATSHIPPGRRQWFIAEGASLLAKATLHLAQSGSMPAAEKQAAGQEAIILARQSMEIHTALHGAESDQVGEVMLTLANILDEFNDFDDDEALRLHERAKVIHGRVQGSLSPNVAAGTPFILLSFPFVLLSQPSLHIHCLTPSIVLHLFDFLYR